MIPLIDPFNNDPINTGSSNSSYTVPSGKYARVRVNLSASTSVGLSNKSSFTVATLNTSLDSNSASFDLFLKSGDTVTVTSSSPSDQVNFGQNQTISNLLMNVSPYASFTFSGNTTSIYVSGFISGSMTKDGANNTASINLTSNANALIQYSEYLSIT
jgi:hypothetical protein